MSDIDVQMEQLKAHFGVEKDVDLAKQLMIDKRTVSAWRARGAVPARYQSIAQVGDPQSIMTPPARWDEHERAAFDLAMFRMARALLPETATGEFRSTMQAFGGAWAYFWDVMTKARRDLVGQMDDGSKEVRSAFALLMHAELQNDAEAVADVRKVLSDLGKLSEK
ncbi:helix-turn-helix domain-containing protein [Paracoccus sp. DMF-8]|uniref:helix-turn-helix domain-containing protein n=1 Tax=Paracoccus sp. DMF-8 TaxID=3019445 RepID=UPI0023E789D7|nr:helix-turn-helix domain-containing protein [Paracoccus sp. DMF-8]MDF3606244.1 helix-turn-helix domain-containing protein [Paracoccus sp. DMF-8]